MRISFLRTGSLAAAVVIGLGGTAIAQPDTKAADVLAGTRKAIGGKKLDTLTSLSVQAAAQRNIGNFQMTSDLELLVDMPDKYLRSETANGPMVNMASTTGFNGDRALKGSGAMGTPGGGMIIRMGGPGPGPGPAASGGSGEKPTPEQQAQLDKQIIRSARQEIGRLMLGWFAMAHPSLGVQYAYAGEAESPDGKALMVDAKNSDGFAARLFIDDKTHLPLMVTYQGPQPRTVTVGAQRPGGDGSQTPVQSRQASSDEQKKLAADANSQIDRLQKQAPVMVEYAIFFDDWRDEDGIKFPHVLRKASAGTTTEEWTISKVKVNPKIDPKKFDSEH
jgi:hypothetical protein